MFSNVLQIYRNQAGTIFLSALVQLCSTVLSEKETGKIETTIELISAFEGSLDGSI